MQLTSLLKDVKFVRGKNAVAAGTSNQTTITVDTHGYDGVAALALLGTLTATQVTKLKAQHGDASDGSDAADITGGETAAAADADSNKMLLCDVRRLTKRYVTFVLERGTANAVLDGIVIMLYRGATRPVTQDATYISQSVGISDS